MDLGIAELREQRGRPVVGEMHGPGLVFVEQRAEWSIETSIAMAREQTIGITGLPTRE